MTRIRMDVVHVQMSELRSQTFATFPWETPILKAVHGDTSVNVESETELELDLSDADQEFHRLVRRYGVDIEQGGVPYVAQVYGAHGIGVSKLADEMQKAVIKKSAA